MINTVKNTTYYRSKTDLREKNTPQPSFKGGFNNVLGNIESNPVLSLVIIDLFGMIIPRSIIDLKRNKEELGHLNWDAGRETILREGVTSFLLFFTSGLIATGLGNLFLKHRFKDEGINTRAFIDFKTLESSKEHLDKIIESGQSEISIKDLRQKYIESMLEDASSSMQGESLSKLEESFDTDDKIITKFKEYVGKEEHIKLADIKQGQKDIKKQFKRLELHHELELKELDIAGKIKKLFGESKINIKNGINDKKGFSICVDNFIKNTVIFADDLILRPALKVANKTNPDNIGDTKINLKEFNKKFSETFEHLRKFKTLKLYTAFFTTLALLIAFPRFNMWVSRKFTGNDEFPGVKGLSGDIANPQKKSGLFLFKKPEENRL